MSKRRILVAAAVLLAMTASVGWLVFFSSVLAVNTVAVHGTSALSPETVRAALGIAPGTPLARVDLAAAETALENITQVESANVSRDWPNTLVVQITERTAVAAVQIDGTTWLLDRFGVRFAQVTDAPDGVVPLELSGGGTDEAATGAALVVLQALDPGIRALLVNVDASIPTAIQLDLTEGRTVMWGGPENSTRKSQILSGLLAGGVVGTVYDVSSPTSAVIR